MFRLMICCTTAIAIGLAGGRALVAIKMASPNKQASVAAFPPPTAVMEPSPSGVPSDSGPPVAASDASKQCRREGAIGVSRTIEIDATGGPWLGAPHGDRDLLAPGEVVLTFDDGPAPYSTRLILAALAAQCAKATFFMVGKMAAEYPDVVREAAEQGHSIGTHTWSHKNLKRIAVDKMKEQIEMAFVSVEKAAGTRIAPFFRYPYLSHNPAAVAYLQSRNIAQFAIDIDSFDWRHRDAQSIVSRVMAGLEHLGRGIILLHDIHAATAAAVPELLVELKNKEYRIVHLRSKTAVDTLADTRGPMTERPASKSRNVALGPWHRQAANE
jgi:peptidoglycan/xylan/chitin deacetylase (PgdA/CDA1 family)